jgi:hypothetical protein
MNDMFSFLVAPRKNLTTSIKYDPKLLHVFATILEYRVLDEERRWTQQRLNLTERKILKVYDVISYRRWVRRIYF